MSLDLPRGPGYWPPLREGLRGVSRGHQAHFSTEQPEAQAAPRVPFAHGHQERPEGAGSPPRQGPQAPERLEPPSDNRAYPDVGVPTKSPSRLERLTRAPRVPVRRRRRSERKRCLVVQARPRPQPRDAAGDGLPPPSKVGGSVVRNRARRRLREAARLLLPRLGLPGVDYVFIAAAGHRRLPLAAFA